MIDYSFDTKPRRLTIRYKICSREVKVQSEQKLLSYTKNHSSLSKIRRCKIINWLFWSLVVVLNLEFIFLNYYRKRGIYIVNHNVIPTIER